MYESGMYLGKPNIGPLNLDLATFWDHGGGLAHFEGVLQDGRKIFVRYRFGWITVYIAQKNEDIRVHPPVRRERIGQGYSGNLFLEQLCELLGLTVEGKSFSVSEQEFARKCREAPYQDFSGRTIYWEQFHLAVSYKGLSNYIASLSKIFGSVYVLEAVRGSANVCSISSILETMANTFDKHFYIACNRGEDTYKAPTGTAFGHQEVKEKFDFCAYAIVRATGLPPYHDDHPIKAVLPKFEFYEAFKLDLRWESLTRNSFRVDCGKDFVAEHHNHFRDDFSFVDLITGQTVPVPEQLEPGWSAYSTDLGEWSSQKSNRLLGMVVVGRESETLGVKPSAAETTNA